MEWADNYKSLLDSEFGKELIRTLEEDLRASLLDNAQRANDMETAYGFTKEASGVTKVIDHLRGRAVIPRVEGGKGKQAQ